MEKREQVELNGLNTSFERLQNDKEILFNLPSNEWKTLNLNFNEHRGRKRKESIEERISKRRGSMLFQCWTKREPEDKAWQVYIEMKERDGGLVNVQDWITNSLWLAYLGRNIGTAIGMCSKEELLKGSFYTRDRFEKLLEFDRFDTANSSAWIEYAEAGLQLENFALIQTEHRKWEIARSLYGRLISLRGHVKLWISYAIALFEAQKPSVPRAFQNDDEDEDGCCADTPTMPDDRASKDSNARGWKMWWYRVTLLRDGKTFEGALMGTADDVINVSSMMPIVAKKRYVDPKVFGEQGVDVSPEEEGDGDAVGGMRGGKAVFEVVGEDALKRVTGGANGRGLHTRSFTILLAYTPPPITMTNPIPTSLAPKKNIAGKRIIKNVWVPSELVYTKYLSQNGVRYLFWRRAMVWDSRETMGRRKERSTWWVVCTSQAKQTAMTSPLPPYKSHWSPMGRRFSPPQVVNLYIVYSSRLQYWNATYGWAMQTLSFEHWYTSLANNFDGEEAEFERWYWADATVSQSLLVRNKGETIERTYNRHWMESSKEMLRINRYPQTIEGRRQSTAKDVMNLISIDSAVTGDHK
ncbi:hypothetical protein F5880DRAFT_1508296 [Lentinula raphanica]|nr:hypothetical protein F5880DRAFT_1508296 [Lentinula raphanica]